MAATVLDHALRVLHLEDSPLDHELTLAHLRRGGLEVQALRIDSEGAFLAALEQDWDVVLSDFNLPGFSGLVALDLLKASGVELAIITGRTSRCVELRARNLGITRLYQGVENKYAAMQSLLADLDLPPESVAFMGDDVIDLPVMRRVGVAFSVPDAPQCVRDRADYVSQRAGGHGAVREVCELIMSAQGTLEAQLAPYLEQ